MDITGSMGPYLEQAKNNVINIINKIILECPGIDVNLGFVGYREVGEEYINKQFTQEYTKLQNSIKDIVASGGVGDGPEDMALGMEMAVNKNWKSNSRFAILVADYPCHGSKYHSIPTDLYPNGAPNRRNIEELVNELASKYISLFCMKLTSHTDIMFKIFKDIYSQYKNCQYDIIPMNSAENLSNVVVDSAAEIYISQRNK